MAAARAAGIPPELAIENVRRAVEQFAPVRSFLAQVTRPRLVCDIDGTLAQRDLPALVALNTKFDTKFRYDGMTEPGGKWIEDKDIRKWYEKHYHDPEFLVDLPPYQDAIWALWSLRSGGYHVTVASDREPELEAVSKTWLHEHGIECDDIKIGDGEKNKIADDATPDEPVVFFDDNPDRAKDLPRPGVQVFLLDRPWNQGVSGDGVVRVKSWREIIDLLPAQSLTATAGKALLAEITKQVGWDESLHPRGEGGRFTVSGTAEARQIVDHVLQPMHDGMTQRSMATHRTIYRELNRAGLRQHAEHYWRQVQQQRRSGTTMSTRMIHPRTAFGRANYAQHQAQQAQTTEARPAAAPPTTEARPPSSPTYTGRTYFSGDLTRPLANGMSRGEFAGRMIQPPGGRPVDYVREYRNARNAGMTHDEIMRATADEANRRDPGRSDPYTPQRVESALTEQYRAAGRTFTPGATSYTVGGVSYQWGTRPPFDSRNTDAPTIGRVVGEARPPAEQPAPSPRQPEVAGPPPSTGRPADAGIRGTGPGGRVTAADRILAAHPTGGVNDEVKALYERDLLKFQLAGGQLIHLRNGDPRFGPLTERYNQNARTLVTSGDSRHTHGASFLESNLRAGRSSSNGGSVIALDKDGVPVAAVGYGGGPGSNELHVGVAGSTGRIPGAGIAMQWGMANVCAEYGKPLGSSYLPDAKPAHASWGRSITASGHSGWSLTAARTVASYRAAGPTIQRAATGQARHPRSRSGRLAYAEA